MKIGIDSYCYHRFFGEVYPDQKPARRPMTVDDFLARAKQLDVDGVSLETCFLPSTDDAYLSELKGKLDGYGFDRVWAWGHPFGLERGKNEDAFKELLEFIPKAAVIGARVMRMTGSSLDHRFEDHQEQIRALLPWLKTAAKVAEDNGVIIAIENHMDFTSAEVMQMLESVDSKHFGVNFDSGNFLRLLDDPVAAMELLAPYVYSTHIKDLCVSSLYGASDHRFFSGVPVGMGIVDNDKLAGILAKHNYEGFLAVEIDQPAPEWQELEDEAVGISIKALREIGEKY